MYDTFTLSPVRGQDCILQKHHRWIKHMVCWQQHQDRDTRRESECRMRTHRIKQQQSQGGSTSPTQSTGLASLFLYIKWAAVRLICGERNNTRRRESEGKMRTDYNSSHNEVAASHLFSLHPSLPSSSIVKSGCEQRVKLDWFRLLVVHALVIITIWLEF